MNCNRHVWVELCRLWFWKSLFQVPTPRKTDTAVTGAAGCRGPVGAKGVRGLQGGRANPPEINGFLFTKHSQKASIPGCPAGSSVIYSGYSLLFINGNNRAHGQDLGNVTKTDDDDEGETAQ